MTNHTPKPATEHIANQTQVSVPMPGGNMMIQTCPHCDWSAAYEPWTPRADRLAREYQDHLNTHCVCSLNEEGRGHWSGCANA